MSQPSSIEQTTDGPPIVLGFLVSLVLALLGAVSAAVLVLSKSEETLAAKIDADSVRLSDRWYGEARVDAKTARALRRDQEVRVFSSWSPAQRVTGRVVALTAEPSRREYIMQIALDADTHAFRSLPLVQTDLQAVVVIRRATLAERLVETVRRCARLWQENERADNAG